MLEQIRAWQPMEDPVVWQVDVSRRSCCLWSTLAGAREKHVRNPPFSLISLEGGGEEAEELGMKD